MRALTILAVCALAAGTASAQGLFDYSGPDRMEKIAAAAKKEGSVTMYTTFAETYVVTRFGSEMKSTAGAAVKKKSSRRRRSSGKRHGAPIVAKPRPAAETHDGGAAQAAAPATSPQEPEEEQP